MTKWLGIVGFLVCVSATAATVAIVSRDVLIEPVALQLADGTPLAATLYRPRTTSDCYLPAAVVLHGTACARASCEPGLSIPLARQGVIVLAIDLPGHGESGGSLPAEVFHSCGRKIPDVHPEVDAAIDFLYHRADFNRWHDGLEGPTLALVGHSLGGLIATDAGRREEIRAVVCVGAAPATCDLTQPRNLLIVTGSLDSICSREKGMKALTRARGGVIIGAEDAFGDVVKGTERRQINVGWVTHLTELADEKVSLSAMEWVTNAMKHRSTTESTEWLRVMLMLVILATVGGMLAAVAILAAMWRTTPTPSSTPVHFGLLVSLGLLLVGVVPIAAELCNRIEGGPVYFAASAVGLMTLIGLITLAGALSSHRGTLLNWRSEVRASGIALGLAALVLAFGWFGVPWGISWESLIPTPRRLVLAGVLWPLLLPGCLALAIGIGQLVRVRQAARWSRLASGLTWLAIPLALGLGQMLLTAGHQPLFLVPVGLLSMSFLAPLPLWLLMDGPGMTLARAVCHSGTAAWVLGCHLPFVHTP